MTTMADVGLVYHQILPTSDHGVGRMASYEDRDPRVTFMSVFPVSSGEGFGVICVRTACQIRRCLHVLQCISQSYFNADTTMSDVLCCIFQHR